MTESEPGGVRTAVTLTVVAIVLLGFIGIMGLVAYKQVEWGYSAARLLAGHETVMGRVTESGMRRDDSHYQFRVEGRTYRGRGGRERAGESIEVAYLGSNPGVHRPVASLWFDLLIGAAIVLALPLIGVVAMVKRRLGSGERAELAGAREGAAQPPPLPPDTADGAPAPARRGRARKWIWAAGACAVVVLGVAAGMLVKAFSSGWSPAPPASSMSAAGAGAEDPGAAEGFEAERESDELGGILDAAVPERAPGPAIRALEIPRTGGRIAEHMDGNEEPGPEPEADEPEAPPLGEPRFRVVWAGYGTHERFTNVTIEVRERAASERRIDTKASLIRPGLTGNVFDTLFELDGVLMRMFARVGRSGLWLDGGRPPGPGETAAESERVAQLGRERDGVEVVWARFGKHHRGEERYVVATDEVRRMLAAEGRIQNSRTTLGLADPVPGWNKHLWVLFSVRGRPMCVVLRMNGQFWVEPSLENRRRPPGL